MTIWLARNISRSLKAEDISLLFDEGIIFKTGHWTSFGIANKSENSFDVCLCSVDEEQFKVFQKHKIVLGIDCSTHTEEQRNHIENLLYSSYIDTNEEPRGEVDD